MPKVTNATPGNFCWIELNTSDLAAAKSFYAKLFDWHVEDMVMPGAPPYAMARLGDAMVGGLGVLPEEAKKMGAPPHWLSYVAVEDAAAGTKKATELGAKLLYGPESIGPGIFAILQDPTGAVFALWQQLQSMGSFVHGEPGALGWNELHTKDVDRAGKFYTNLFGWRADAQQMPGMVYTVFKRGEEMLGGMMAQTAQMAGAPSSWCVYFSVDDADATAAKAKQLGGSVLSPPMDIPEIGRFAVLADQQGAAFAVIKFLPQS